MQYGHIPGINKPVSRLIQGTASGFDPDNAEEAFALLDMVFEHGFNTFDTAENYGPAREIVFGQWLRTRGVRDQVVILAKGAHPYERNRVTPEDIEADMQGTMARMGVDYIVEALTKHQKAGRIGAFGGSNWAYERIQVANEYARAHNLTPFAVSNPNFSLAEQFVEPWANCVSISGPQGEAARQWYAQDGIALFAWSSLASGFFSERFQRDNAETFGKDDYWAQLVLRSYCREPNFQRLDRVRELAQKKSLATPQIALAYVLNQPMNVFALTMCANREQFVANIAALELKLTPLEIAYLD